MSGDHRAFLGATLPFAPTREQRAHPRGSGTPVPADRPVTMTAGGQRIVVRTWQIGGTEAVVATSGQPFLTPARAQRGSRGNGVVGATGKLGLYCANGRTSKLVAVPVPVAVLAALAARLPPS